MPTSPIQAQFHELLTGARFQRTLCTISCSETALRELHNEAKRGHSEMILNDVLHRAVGEIDDPGKASLSSSTNVNLHFQQLGALRRAYKVFLSTSIITMPGFAG